MVPIKAALDAVVIDVKTSGKGWTRKGIHLSPLHFEATTKVFIHILVDHGEMDSLLWASVSWIRLLW